MNRLDRTMGILLLLRGGRIVSATELSRRFEVSIRTVYRDIEVLSGLGVPIGADMGRTGGFSLREGYFLPPVTLGPEEATSLLLGLILMRRLRVMPFPKEADFAERKLLAAFPAETRAALERASRFMGFESVPADLLHPERDDPTLGLGPPPAVESEVVGAFLRALLGRSRITITYHSPNRAREEPREIEPLGLVWDRDRWYLVGRPGEGRQNRMWRADRVIEIGPGRSMPPLRGDFDVATILDRRWLHSAMEEWRKESPVRIAMRPEQAGLLKRDWYYGAANFEEGEDGRVVMTYGEYGVELAAALIRWLGPGAELLEPREWRPLISEKLEALLAAHRD
jgi:predicted DNA-binding transcriptional regulator YafY